MEEKLQEIISNIFDIRKEEVNDSLTPESIENWDSMAHLQMVTAIESEFQIKLSMEDIQKIDSFKKLKEILQKYKSL